MEKTFISHLTKSQPWRRLGPLALAVLPLTGMAQMALGSVITNQTLNAGTYTISLAAGQGAQLQGNGGGSQLVIPLQVVVLAPTATGGSNCAAGPVTLLASGAPSGGSYRWYTQATGGTAISGATGGTYTTPTLYASTTYYVSAVDGGGTESSRTAARATVFNTLPIRIIAGGPTTFTAPGQSVSLAAQQKNLALQFNGSSQYVNTTLMPSPANLPTTTWEAWVYPTLNNSSEQDLLSSDAGGYSRAIALISGNFVFGNGSNYTTAVAATFNTWQHVAVVYSGGSATFYKNGVAVATAVATFGGSSFTNFNIGRGPTYGNYFQGQLDEARVWSTARTPVQIQASMNQGQPGTTAGLVGWPPLDWAARRWS